MKVSYKKLYLSMMVSLFVCVALYLPSCTMFMTDEAKLQRCEERIELKDMAGKSMSDKEIEECYALMAEEEARVAEENERMEREKAQEESKKQEELEKKAEKIRKNLIVKNYSANVERGAYVITFDIENKNEFPVGGKNIGFLIPYTYVWEDEYGDRQEEIKHIKWDIDVIAAGGTSTVRAVLREDLSKDKETSNFSGDKVVFCSNDSDDVREELYDFIELASNSKYCEPLESGQMLTLDDFEFATEDKPSIYKHVKVTNKSSHKIKSITFKVFILEDNGNYRFYDDVTPVDGTGTVWYLKPGATADETLSTNRGNFEIIGIGSFEIDDNNEMS